MNNENNPPTLAKDGGAWNNAIITRLNDLEKENATMREVLAENDKWHLERIGNPFKDHSRDQLERALVDAVTFIRSVSDAGNQRVAASVKACASGCLDRIEAIKSEKRTDRGREAK